MSIEKYNDLIPEQHTGLPIDTEESVQLNTDEDAVALFRKASKKLLDVNNWHSIAGDFSARFQLFAPASCTAVDGFAASGLYFRIEIPGPGTSTGDGFDWVIIEDVLENHTEDTAVTGIRVRPASNPLHLASEETAHFYDKDATSTFVVIREGRKVKSGIYDRNTKPNTKGDTLLDKARGLLTGTAGVLIGSRIQWRNLAIGLLKMYS